MEKQVKKQKKPSEYNWTPLGKPTFILTIIFCIVECLLAIFLLYNAIAVFTSTDPKVEQQQKIAAIIGLVVGVVIFVFGISATDHICKRTRAGLHVNMALACGSVFFFNPITGILTVVYSASVPARKSAA
mgnify:CR=1 FL=1